MSGKKKKVYGKNDRLANVVWIGTAKPNKMFPDWLTELVRFLRYTEPVACAHCGKMRKKHWTCLAAFRACTMGQFALAKSEVILPPLSPICGDHPFHPVIINIAKKP
jgi:hypothetical protein